MGPFLDLNGLTTYHNNIMNHIAEEEATLQSSIDNHTNSQVHVPAGGSSGTILSKKSNNDGDYAWVENSISCQEKASKSFLLGSDNQTKVSGTCNTNATCYMESGSLFTTNLTATGTITGTQVFNAVFNDLVDCVEVDDNTPLTYGKCYCYDGKKYYPSTKYLGDNLVIGIHSDTYGIKMGEKNKTKELNIAVAGFVLAYVDQEYPPGTPLTCTQNGYLTKMNFKDKRMYPEKFIALFWKPELNKIWGTDERPVKVNGRYWVKIV